MLQMSKQGQTVIMVILQKGILEGVDISKELGNLRWFPGANGKLYVVPETVPNIKIDKDSVLYKQIFNNLNEKETVEHPPNLKDSEWQE